MSFLSTLSKAARRAYAFIKAGVRRGLSANSIQKALSAAGQGLRRSTVQDMVRAEKGVQAPQARLRTMRRDFRPNPAALPPALHETRRRYTFVIRVTGQIADTGQTITRRVSVSTDTLMTRAELEKRAIEITSGNQGNYPFRVDTAQLESGIRSPDLEV